MIGLVWRVTRDLVEKDGEEKLGNASSRTGCSIQLAGFQGEGMSEGTNPVDFATKDVTRPRPAA